MKKSILTALLIVFTGMGLMAQSKKADSAAKVEHTSTPYVLTHKDSVLIEKATKEAKTKDMDYEVPPVRGVHPFTDLIDERPEIK